MCSSDLWVEWEGCEEGQSTAEEGCAGQEDCCESCSASSNEYESYAIEGMRTCHHAAMHSEANNLFELDVDARVLRCTARRLMGCKGNVWVVIRKHVS